METVSRPSQKDFDNRAGRIHTSIPSPSAVQNSVDTASRQLRSIANQPRQSRSYQDECIYQHRTSGEHHSFPRENPSFSQYRSLFHDAPTTMLDGKNMILKGLPVEATISEVYKSFKKFGRPEHIDIFEHKDTDGQPTRRARLRFEDRPNEAFFQTNVHILQLANGTQYGLQVELQRRRPEPLIASQRNSKRFYPERMCVKASSIDFGIMLEPAKMLIKRQIERKMDSVTFGLNLRYEELTIEFPLTISTKSEKFKLTVPFNRMSNVKILESQENVMEILFELEDPPKYFRHIKGTRPHEKAQTWNENDSWFRQTDIVMDQQILKTSPLTLKRPNAFLDVGRWTTYHLVFDMNDTKEARMQAMQKALLDFNVDFVALKDVTFDISQSTPFWDNIDGFSSQQMTDEVRKQQIINTIDLPFEVRYQLEVCISHGILNEHNLSRLFMERLAALDTATAREVLESAVVRKSRIFDPMTIFEGHSNTLYTKNSAPDYCTLVRSVIVTPTMIKLHTPTVETSNRVLRQYADNSDRFIRVRFAEEGARSKIFATDKNTENEVFTRIKRTFANGIMIGDRKFEFLAFGNSQFREHGAYFFSPLPDLLKGEIRAWMGYFAHIKSVALFAARLGQCFSTTRAISTQARTVEIRDIRRNGYCFSDGVGRISPVLAQVVADSIGLTQKNQEPPSVFQFRLGGCKGVLTVWPTIEDKEIHIRETQYKFPAVHEGLEIIRCSQFASANLNRQIILVLSTLGVPDDIFIGKLKTQLADVEKAVKNPEMALKILQRDIDHNQMTLKIAGMVRDGFQERDEPFVKSLLHLWRAWSIKLLKEKARITISKGALLLGCLDETGILKGHFDRAPTLPEGPSAQDRAEFLPQVFVQLSKGPRGTAAILTGPMLLARNPSLHPGDIRVVCGVDVPELHHLKDCVVLPQTGDRDVASMCSGGDLDGDDFEVIWDQDLLPRERNHEPMDYTPPKKIEHHKEITDDDLTNFFIKYIKNDSLATIAHAHVAHADMSDLGVKDPKCLRLAALHSKAVDFVKTGQEAIMTADLRPKKFPHFMEKKNKKKCYTSRKILGQMFDLVERVTFKPELLTSFDDRILKAFDHNHESIERAKRLKGEYDNHMRRILAQHAINTEFEVWSIFVMQHNHTNDYKMQENMAQVSGALKDQFRKRCIDIAGSKDYEQLAPFVAAMYQVTANEVNDAIEQGRQTALGPEAYQMPFISFPWLFQDILGKIAKLNNPEQDDADQIVDVTPGTKVTKMGARGFMAKDKMFYTGLRDFEDSLETTKGLTHRGDLLELDFEPEAEKSGPVTESAGHASAFHDTSILMLDQDSETVSDAALYSPEEVFESSSGGSDRKDPAGAIGHHEGGGSHSDTSETSTVEDFEPPPTTSSMRAKLAALKASGDMWYDVVSF